METHEARMHPRVPLREKVSVIASASAPPLRLWASDLSEGGVCLHTNHPFRRGDRVGLRLRCRDSEICIPNSEVAWVVRDVKGSSRVPSIGLRFLTVPPEDRQSLRDLIDAHVPSNPAAAVAATPALLPIEPLPTVKETAAAMHNEPSLPPPGPRFDMSLPPLAETLPPSHAPGIAPIDESSLGPLPAEDARWEFSDPTPDMLPPRKTPLSNGGFALGAGLLVVGTLAGMIFGVMDQSARRPAPGVAPVATAADPAVEAPAAPAPAVTRPAAPPAPAPTVAAAPVPAPQKRTAPPTAPAPEKAVTPTLPLPAHKPGRIAIGNIAAHGRDLIVPIRGVKQIERQFVLKNPNRVVLDVAADGYDGPAELAGRGSLQRIRVGRRPNGVRLVLDVSSNAVAEAARVTRHSGVMAVVLPTR